ncbi:hypothetical protein CcaverHIS002_0211280 [Cutaneotrichosporon cavernicola]|uniref:Uncharacterized protein n=1 Tax=Cutaneotrichosporon cavernicola TaxID=279322 RepID=A0AA48L1J8_9TREE|nr:uncharacterized protein CcaverHIS019_0211270 [Cutaneotrichosporon cavernicola]BEI81968.1 hypothetical protein CcaverHIS002_0211280 [Cutaneotrichosporon cavernicola]BEI89765.1 hypothetical protein CcaverHIS019_0211270 [Cutaneotrichosporon cavernicola]
MNPALSLVTRPEMDLGERSFMTVCPLARGSLGKPEPFPKAPPSSKVQSWSSPMAQSSLASATKSKNQSTDPSPPAQTPTKPPHDLPASPGAPVGRDQAHEILAALLVLVGLLNVQLVKSPGSTMLPLVGPDEALLLDRNPTLQLDLPSCNCASDCVAARREVLRMQMDAAAGLARIEQADPLLLRLVRFLWRMWAGEPEPAYVWWCSAEEMRKL